MMSDSCGGSSHMTYEDKEHYKDLVSESYRFGLND